MDQSYKPIRLATERISHLEECSYVPLNDKVLVAPGDVVPSDSTSMRGHGTYYNSDNQLTASVAGFVSKINKLVRVQPLKSRYNGETGDVVVGRVIEVQQRRWIVDTNSRLDSVLLLSSVNLPGGEQRRRQVEDELSMRDYLQEGDLISAEVQQVYGSDGSLSLHTRSLKYGKLSQGILVVASPSVIKRSKNHFHNLPMGVSLILGNNGYVWVCPPIATFDDSSTLAANSANEGGGFVQNLEPVSFPVREAMVRVANCVRVLASFSCPLFDTSIIYAYDAAVEYQAKQILEPEIASDMVQKVRFRLQQDQA